MNPPEPLPKIKLSKREVDLKLQNSFCDSLMLSNNIVSEQSQEYKKLDALLQDILIDYTDIDLNKQECKNYIYARIVERAVYTNNDALFQLLLKSFDALKSSNLLTVQTKQEVAFVQSTWAFQYALAHSKGYYLEEILNIVEDRMDKLRLFFSIDQFAPSFKISEMRLLMIKSPDQLLEMQQILLANSVQNISREEIPYQDIDVDGTVYCSLDGLYKETQCKFNNKSIIPILFCNCVDVYQYDEFIKVHLNIQDTIKYFNEFQDLIEVELTGFCKSVGLCSEG
ncbi:hypothetical protein [Candidatus Tisiphia endosymbiont of Parasteatoda lunata]|uniref:hypothetical protein n=1 Tax=Candidatus Tisiphia endosymbiont of Parasteatoda lunata TaxID=3066275 RepID=UPI00313BD918